VSDDASLSSPARDHGTLQGWSEVAEAIRATSRRLEKGTLLATYLASLDEASLAIAARFFSGVVFPRHDAGTTKVGGAIVFGALAAASGRDETALGERYVAHGDTGDLAGEVLADRPPSHMTLVEVERLCRTLAAARGTNARRESMRETLARLGGLEARYLVKLLGGELRIGLKEAQVEEALAKAFGRPLAAIRRANLLRGDIGEVALSARHDTLAGATLALFHPIGFMLAQPLATAAEVAAALPAPFAVEDKYDGIRAQAHIGADRVVLFSRTLDAIGHGYPEVVAALATLPAGLVLDGELLAYDPGLPGRALPFKALQQRLGRKRPSAELLAAVPVAFVAYDLLAADGVLVVDESYEARRRRLEALPWPGGVSRLAPTRLAMTGDDVEAAFLAARAAGNEGIVAKDRSAPYAPGRRGGAWIKLKRPLATLDVVVVAVERGHGRRHAVLSDYTFAVRASDDDPSLLTVGKAYNGLTDAEIAALTSRFESLTIERAGGYHRVRPEVVLEVTFDIVQASSRHASGYALRFPRIVRVRDDKSPAEVDTLARVRELADTPPV
jgi:DNA ligase-1